MECLSLSPRVWLSGEDDLICWETPEASGSHQRAVGNCGINHVQDAGGDNPRRTLLSMYAQDCDQKRSSDPQTFEDVPIIIRISDAGSAGMNHFPETTHVLSNDRLAKETLNSTLSTCIAGMNLSQEIRHVMSNKSITRDILQVPEHTHLASSFEFCLVSLPRNSRSKSCSTLMQLVSPMSDCDSASRDRTPRDTLSPCSPVNSMHADPRGTMPRGRRSSSMASSPRTVPSETTPRDNTWSTSASFYLNSSSESTPANMLPSWSVENLLSAHHSGRGPSCLGSRRIGCGAHLSCLASPSPHRRGRSVACLIGRSPVHCGEDKGSAFDFWDFKKARLENGPRRGGVIPNRFSGRMGETSLRMQLKSSANGLVNTAGVVHE